MYAIFEDSGRQYKVTTGDKIFVDLRELPEDRESIEFDRVLALGDGAQARIGQPLVEGAKVVGKVQAEAKGPKLTGTIYRRRKNFRRSFGHRQRHLEVTISEIIG